MKTRDKALAGLLLIGLGTFLLLQFLRQGAMTESPATAGTNRIILPPPSTNAPDLAEEILTKVPVLGEYQRAKLQLESENVPINFWGKVVDQDGRPLGGVKVQMRLRSWHLRGITPVGSFDRFTLETSSNGLFEVRNLHGDLLEIETIESQGYVSGELARRSFGYGPNRSAPYVADTNTPFVFKMFDMALGSNDPIKEFVYKGRIACDGTPLFLNVLTPKTNEGENAQRHIEITFNRDPVKIPLGSLEYDWRIEVKVRDGGLIVAESSVITFARTSRLFMYEAPPDGYELSHEIVMRRSDPHWVKEKEFSFYFQIDGGKYYGRCTVYIDSTSNTDRTNIRIRGEVNPTGSRMLQKKRI